MRDKPFRPKGIDGEAFGSEIGEGRSRRTAPVEPDPEQPPTGGVSLQPDEAIPPLFRLPATTQEILPEGPTQGPPPTLSDQWPEFDLRQEVEVNRALVRKGAFAARDELTESTAGDGDVPQRLNYAAPPDMQRPTTGDEAPIIFDLREPPDDAPNLPDGDVVVDQGQSPTIATDAAEPPDSGGLGVAEPTSPSVDSPEATDDQNLFGPRPAAFAEPVESSTQNQQFSGPKARRSSDTALSAAAFSDAGRVHLPVIDERASYVNLSDDRFRRRTGPILLTLATLLALLSGLLGALWLRERNATEEVRAQLAESDAVLTIEAETESELEEGAALERIAELEAENNRLEQQLADMSALVLELPEGRVSSLETPYPPFFADEQDGRLVAVDDTGNYAVWGDGAEGGITDTGNLGGTPTALFISRNRAWVSTDESGIAVLTLANDAGPTFVDYGPASFLAEEERGYWTYNPARGEIARLNKSNGEVTNTISIPSGVVDLTIGAGSVWALGDDGMVYRINTADFTLQALDLGDTIIGLTAGPDALWVLSAGDGALRRVDPVTGEVLVSVPVGQDPVDALFASNSVWVALRAGQSLIEVDTQTSAVVSRTGLPDAPTGLHQGEDGVFVTMSDDAQLFHVSSSQAPGNEDGTIADDQG